ncbi:MAG: response regulator, partial [Dehalococcoidia bacterium]|nr:response regulator [Dehalococcoidia bacterium]
LDEMEEAYYEVDLAGNFTFFSDALCRQLGYTREEIMGMSYKVYIPRENAKKVLEAYNHVYRTGEPLKSFASAQIKKDGTRVFTEDSIFPLRNENGEVIGFRGISRDVTGFKRAEEERRQLEQKAQFASRLASVGELASGVAHEINNPLTAVIGYAHLLLERKDVPEDIRRDVEVINEGAQRVAGIIKKLLVFARQTKPERTYVDINEIISTTLELRAYSLQSNNVKVVLQFDPDLPLTVADPGQLQQVFLNLIINAETEVKLAHGGGKMAIKTEQINNTIRVSFKDNGLGIAKENLERIFNPFFTTRRVGQGTGLGLSVCHGIITGHKGRIWAESQLGKGATFIVELPIVTEDKQLELPEPVAKRPDKVTGAKILVVDDEAVVRQFVSQMLIDEGHEVEVADSAESVLETIKGKDYQVIMLDIKMPGVSGIELYKHFQKVSLSLAEKVIFITGDVMGPSTMAFLSRTKVPYIIKPFDAKQLRAEINRVLARE